MNECVIHVWGGAWNNDAEPSIEKDYSMAEGHYYFKNKKAKNKFLRILENPIYQEQGIVYDLCFEYPDEAAEYYFLCGDNSCDCDISTIIRWEYGDSAIPQLGCGNEIKLIAYKIEHWNSGYQRYNGDETMRKLKAKEQELL